MQALRVLFALRGLRPKYHCSTLPRFHRHAPCVLPSTLASRVWPSGLRKHRLASLLRRRQVHQHRADALAAALLVELVREKVMVRAVVLRLLVPQNLDGFSVLWGEHGQEGKALLDAREVARVSVLVSQESTHAGAHRAGNALAVLHVHHCGLLQLGLSHCNHRVALLLRENVVHDDDARGPADHFHPSGARLQCRHHISRRPLRLGIEVFSLHVHSRAPRGVHGQAVQLRAGNKYECNHYSPENQQQSRSFHPDCNLSIFSSPHVAAHLPYMMDFLETCD
mmetsp:Transcript_46737/g.89262  ORF Transcript_46737/g.89262 Transcript_46737/m.89262 type:complete len:281 (+) Transcript_46737:603-1445(+)